MKTRIKICGLTRLEDARFCAAAGADYLGFVLAEDSPRRVSAEVAREIVGWVYGPATVGVFVDTDPDEINRTVREVGFDFVQLHGHETPEACARIEAPVIKAVPVALDTTPDGLAAAVEVYRGCARHVLLDTSVEGRSGGSGRIFDWSIASSLMAGDGFFVAGGLNPRNVRDVIELLDPFAIDVSSGVEESPGVKSFDKVSALFDAVRPENS